jgi:hypothetical protein
MVNDVMTKELESKTADLDKRLSILEQTTEGVKAKVDDIDHNLVKLTEGLQKIQLQIAYGMGGFAVAIVIGQIGLQILMKAFNQ